MTEYSYPGAKIAFIRPSNCCHFDTKYSQYLGNKGISTNQTTQFVNCVQHPKI